MLLFSRKRIFNSVFLLLNHNLNPKRQRVKKGVRFKDIKVIFLPKLKSLFIFHWLKAFVRGSAYHTN